MNKFHTNITVYEMENFKDFVESFKIKKGDFILTQRLLYENYMKSSNLDCEYLFYEDYPGGDSEPTEDKLNEILKDLSQDVKRIIAIGGGSVLDTAKILSIKDAKSVLDIFEEKIPLIRNKELILIPTTCGTGSEMDGIVAVYLNKFGSKIGKGIDSMVPDASILIPEFLKTLPFKNFMYNSVDALAHNMEIYLSPLNHAFSNVFCAEGTRLIVRNYKRIIDKGPEERLNHLKEFLRASAYGGIGLSHNTCGAVHACSMYFGGVHHTPHGLTNSLFLGPVMKLYAKKAPEGTFLKDLAKIICTEMEIEADTKGTFKALDKMIDSILPREKLRTFGMPADSSYKYAQNVLDPNRQKRILDNNYVSLSVEEVANLFDELY